MARSPSTPDCAIKGCTEAARRLGMCKKHSALAPRSFSIAVMTEGLDAQFKAAERVRRRAQAYVRKQLAAEA